jgi:hypothetical protein
VYTVKEEGRKPDRKPNPLLYGLRNPYRNLKSENSPRPARLHGLAAGRYDNRTPELTLFPQSWIYEFGYCTIKPSFPYKN